MCSQPILLKHPLAQVTARDWRSIALYLFQWQQHELLSLGHLHKMLQDVLVRRLEQVAAGVRVSEPPDAQAVGGVQLAEQELAAGIPHSVELQQAGCWEQRLGGWDRNTPISQFHQPTM